jgi:cytochrome c biogenesis protein CcdA
MSSSLQLLLRVLPFAIAGALMAVILSDRHRALQRGIAFTLGAAVPIVALTFAVITFLDQLELPIVQHGPGTLSFEIDVFTGTILITLGLLLLLKPGLFARRSKTKVETHKMNSAGSSSASLFRTFWFGFGMMAINGTTILMLIPAAKEIAAAQVRPASKITVALIVDGIMLLSVLVPLTIYALRPRESAELMEQAQAWVKRNVRPVVGWAALLIGCYLIAKSFLGL